MFKLLLELEENIRQCFFFFNLMVQIYFYRVPKLQSTQISTYLCILNMLEDLHYAALLILPSYWLVLCKLIVLALY